MTSAIVCGLAGWSPVGGMGLHYLQYCLGLRELGLEVLYLEDNGWIPARPGPYHEDAADPYGAKASAAWLASMFDPFGIEWAYADPEGDYTGLDAPEVEARCASADVLLNVSGGHTPMAHHRRSRRLVYVDTEPGFVHVKAARGDQYTRELLDAHDAHLTWAELAGTADCRLPDTGHDWKPTRQPVHLPLWSGLPDPADARYTTVMNWGHREKHVEWRGERWGQKDSEFPIIERLPARTGLPLEVAVKAPDEVEAALRHHGWRVVDAWSVSADIWQLRNYIAGSSGEITITKQAYVRSRSGWFPERSANYLAAGRPVVCQDTGWSAVLGEGEGLLGFETTDEAERALQQVHAEPGRHRAAARRLAAEHFDGRRVLDRLLDAAGVD